MIRLLRQRKSRRAEDVASPGRRRERGKRGQSLVEFAFGLPTLLLIMLGTLDMGQMFFQYIDLRGAVREAAAYGARTECDTAGIEDAVYRSAPELSSDTDVEITWDPICNAPYGTDAVVHVSATRVFHPIMTSFLGDFGLDSVTMTASASAKVWT